MISVLEQAILGVVEALWRFLEILHIGYSGLTNYQELYHSSQDATFVDCTEIMEPYTHLKLSCAKLMSFHFAIFSLHIHYFNTRHTWVKLVRAAY